MPEILILIFTSLWLSPGTPAALAAGEGSEFFVRTFNPANEQYQRDVDEVARAAQEKAISKLSGLLKKYRNTRQEPILLAKLAELQQQNASILFRIAHASAHRGKGKDKAIDLSRYNREMEQSIAALNTLIAKYPGFEEIPHSFFLRGKAYEEIGKKDAATKDYLHLVKNFPDVPEAPSAYMSLAEFSIEKADFPRAITFLNQIEKLPEDPHYPFALYKLAWAHYNLKDIPRALSYGERQVAYYNDRVPKSAAADTSPNSDFALRDNTLLDITTFYLDGMEQGLVQCRHTEALTYFRKLESGPILGKMIVKFAKLLRSHEHEKELIAWKDQIIVSEADRPESLDVLITTYEHQLNKRLWPSLLESARDMARIYPEHKKYEGFVRAQKLLLETADGMQKSIIKNSGSDEAFAMSKTLATIYDSFTKIVEESDPRIPRVHHNLAETLFTIKDYPGATEHYRWVVDHGSWDKKGINYATTVEASLKAIGSRYEVLRQKNLIPKEVNAVPMQKNSDKELDPLLARWIAWIDTHAKQVEDKKPLENFVFEGNRALYAALHLNDSTERLKKFAQKYPKSTYAIPSASLVVDTMIASGDWSGTVDLAEDFMDVKEWKASDFAKRLFTVSADASYKLIEQQYKSKEYKTVMKMSDKFLKKFDKSQRLADTLALAGNSASELKDHNRATQYFTRLIAEAPKSENMGHALLARGAMAEERYRFGSAAGDYKLYLNLPSKLNKLDEKQVEALRRKIVVLSWLSGNPGDLKTTLDSRNICTEELASFCEKYSILATLSDPGMARDESTTENAFNRTRKDSGEIRTLWGILALEGAKNLAFRDRLLAIRVVAGGWEELDPLIRYAVLPYLSVSITKAFQLNRMGMREVAPLRADERYITRRVEVIREMENAATKVMKLPWARIRAETLNEMAGLYIDLSKGLSSLSPPKGLNADELNAYNETIRKLVLPFEEKGQDMRGKAFEIASRFSIEDESFHQIADPFFAENPSQAKKLRPEKEISKPAELAVKLLDKVDPRGHWDSLKDQDEDNPVILAKGLWASAIEKRRWPQIAYFIQEMKEKKLVAEPYLGIVKGISFASAGARGEGLGEIAEAYGSLPPETRNIAVMTLVHHAIRSCARDRTQTFLKDIISDHLSRDQAGLWTSAQAYAKK